MEIRLSETITVTDIQRRAKDVFARVEKSKQTKFVILKNTEIAAVLLSAKLYEDLTDQLTAQADELAKLRNELAELRK